MEHLKFNKPLFFLFQFLFFIKWSQADVVPITLTLNERSPFPKILSSKECEEIEEIRLIGNHHPTIEIVAGHARTTTPFMKNLKSILDLINSNRKNHPNHLKLQPVLLFDENGKYSDYFPTEPLCPEIPLDPECSAKDFDPWMRDIYAEVLIKFKGKKHFQKAILDTNRDGKLKNISQVLAKKWGIRYVINLGNPDKGGGDFGGNFSVTPQNILYYGNTMEPPLYNFLRSKGYEDNHVVLNTKWLDVGHVDEYVTTMHNPKSPCKMSIIKADPLRALWIMMDKKNSLNNQLTKYVSADQKSEKFYKFFNFLQKYRNKILISNNHQELSFNDIFDIDLNSSDEINCYNLLKSQIRASKEIDFNIQKLIDIHQKKFAKICKDIDVISVPTLYECDFKFAVSAYDDDIAFCTSLIPNSVNMNIIGQDLIIPDPLYDPFKEWITKEFKKRDKVSHFIQDLHLHVNGGEVHCGTNSRSAFPDNEEIKIKEYNRHLKDSGENKYNFIKNFKRWHSQLWLQSRPQQSQPHP